MLPMERAEGRAAPVGAARKLSRRRFLKTAAWAGAALSAAGVGGSGPVVRRAQAQAYTTYQGAGDETFLQFVLQLSRLTKTCYQRGVDTGFFGGSALTQLEGIRGHYVKHVDGITEMMEQMGVEVLAEPAEFTFPQGAFADPTAFLELCSDVEEVDVGTYQGALPVIENKDLLALAISFYSYTCGARCAVNILKGVDPPHNLAFEEALSRPDAQQAAEAVGLPVE